MADKKTGEFERAIERLEQIVRQLESGDVGLDESVHLFREGRDLARSCERLLGEAQKEVEAAAKEPSPAPATGDGGLPF